MSKETKIAQICPGCNQAIYHADYHVEHCAKLNGEAFAKKKKKRKR